MNLSQLKNQFGKTSALTIVISLFLAIPLIGVISQSYKQLHPVVTQNENTNQKEPNTPEEAINLAAKKIIKERLIDSKIVTEKKNKIVVINFYGSDNMTSKLMKRGMWHNSTDIIREIYSIPNLKIDGFSLFVHHTVVDKYSRESDGIVMKIGMTNNTVAKINWVNFSPENVPAIADSYWESPAL